MEAIIPIKFILEEYIPSSASSLGPDISNTMFYQPKLHTFNITIALQNQQAKKRGGHKAPPI
jgi:hypothetical protein